MTGRWHGRRAAVMGLQRIESFGRAGLYFANFFVLLYAAPLACKRFGGGDRALLHLVKLAARNTFRILGHRCIVRGAHRLDPDRPYIYIANHRSWLDHAAAVLTAPHLLHFTGKAAYFDFPVLRTTLRLYRCFPVDRSNSNGLMDRLAACLTDGGSLVMYPEGTRSRNGDFLQFRSGAFVLSARTSVPIAPLYIHGTDRLLRRAEGFSKALRGTVLVNVGEPYTVPHSFLSRPETAPYQSRFMAAYARRAPSWEQL